MIAMKLQSKSASKGAAKPTTLGPSRIVNGFPLTLKTTLKYKEAVLLDPSAGQFKTYLFKTNDLYDPNYTGTGHQPMGYDQLAAIYSHYVVTNSRIKVTQITAPANPSVWGVLVSDNNGSSGPWPAVCEQPGQCVSFMAPTQGTVNAMSVSQKWSLKANAGVSDPMDSAYAGVVGSSPTDAQYYILFLQAMDQSTDLAAQWYLVEIEYDAMFAVKNEMSSS